MLLPIFAPLIAPILAISTRALEFVPTLVAIVLEILAALLTLFAPVAPGFVAVVDTIAPLVVAILRPPTPVRPLFGASRPLARVRTFGWKLAWAITSSDASA
jgi:hypothetical protein